LSLQAKDFPNRGGALRSPKRSQLAVEWSIEELRNARNAQQNGDFALAVSLAKAMKLEPALFTAYHQRIAPQNSVKSVIQQASGSRGKAIARSASSGVHIARSVLCEAHGQLADHGIAILYNDWTTKGTKLETTVKNWPLEHVKHDQYSDTLTTAVDGSLERVPILHGDGFWIVVRKFHEKPWTQEAATLPGALLLGALANASADWSGSSASHGNPRIVGKLAAGVPIRTSEGDLTGEADGFLETLVDLATGDAVAGIVPAGSEVDVMANSSTAYQVFNDLATAKEKNAARIYLGTDAILGSTGGAPGVDISALFGVATTKVQGDFLAFANALNTGVFDPFTAYNYGDTRYSPKIVYCLPDPDALLRAEEESKKLDLLMSAIKNLRENGFIVDQDIVDHLASKLDVSRVPQLAAIESRAVPLTLAPTDLALVIRGKEVRAAQGLPPLGDERDNMLIAEIKALQTTPSNTVPETKAQ